MIAGVKVAAIGLFRYNYLAHKNQLEKQTHRESDFSDINLPQFV